MRVRKTPQCKHKSKIVADAGLTVDVRTESPGDETSLRCQPRNDEVLSSVFPVQSSSVIDVADGRDVCTKLKPGDKTHLGCKPLSNKVLSKRASLSVAESSAMASLFLDNMRVDRVMLDLSVCISGSPLFSQPTTSMRCGLFAV